MDGSYSINTATEMMYRRITRCSGPHLDERVQKRTSQSKKLPRDQHRSQPKISAKNPLINFLTLHVKSFPCRPSAIRVLVPSSRHSFSASSLQTSYSCPRH